MSALGQKRTSRWIAWMSALPPKADIRQGNRDVRFMPKADIGARLDSDFEFEADLHDLHAWNLEIGARSLGIVMHECEKLFTPARHA